MARHKVLASLQEEPTESAREEEEPDSPQGTPKESRASSQDKDITEVHTIASVRMLIVHVQVRRMLEAEEELYNQEYFDQARRREGYRKSQGYAESATQQLGRVPSLDAAIEVSMSSHRSRWQSVLMIGRDDVWHVACSGTTRCNACR